MLAMVRGAIAGRTKVGSCVVRCRSSNQVKAVVLQTNASLSVPAPTALPDNARAAPQVSYTRSASHSHTPIIVTQEKRLPQRKQSFPHQLTESPTHPKASKEEADNVQGLSVFSPLKGLLNRGVTHKRKRIRFTSQRQDTSSQCDCRSEAVGGVVSMLHVRSANNT
jgi:hypothetical protein